MQEGLGKVPNSFWSTDYWPQSPAAGVTMLEGQSVQFNYRPGDQRRYDQFPSRVLSSA